MAISTIDNNGVNLGQLGNRNLIINGSMQVAQRSTSVAGIGADQAAYHTIDRWLIETGGSNSGRFTMSQSSDAPSGFGSSLKLDCTTSDTSIGAGEYLLLEYRIEGQDVQRIKKGTPDAEEITISFYVKANAAFNFVLEVLDSTNSRRCSKLFSTTTGWNRVELTYPADTTGAVANNNAEGIRLFFWIHAGSNYTSGTLNSSSFTTNPPVANIASGISSFYSSTSNEFYLTGFQMEVGDTATPFEHRSYGEELAKCQRYYYKEDFSSNDHAIATQSNWNSQALYGAWSIPTTMRANPTGSYSSLSDFTLYQNSQTRTLTELNFGSNSLSSRELVTVCSSSTSPQGGAGWLRGQSSGWIALDAEL
jgi:hypothetical protein